MLFWGLKLLIIGPLLRLLLRPRVMGASHIPATGPVILAGNHLSFIDPLALAALARRRVHFLAASTYYVKRGFAGRFVGLFLTYTGMKPIDRAGGSASEASLRAGLEVLSKGRVLGIYPEGSRSRDGRLHRGRTGVARLALLSGRRSCRSPWSAPRRSSRCTAAACCPGPGGSRCASAPRSSRSGGRI